jgi:hypothetical protein
MNIHAVPVHAMQIAHAVEAHAAPSHAVHTHVMHVHIMHAHILSTHHAVHCKFYLWINSYMRTEWRANCHYFYNTVVLADMPIFNKQRPIILIFYCWKV